MEPDPGPVVPAVPLVVVPALPVLAAPVLPVEPVVPVGLVAPGWVPVVPVDPVTPVVPVVPVDPVMPVVPGLPAVPVVVPVMPVLPFALVERCDVDEAADPELSEAASRYRGFRSTLVTAMWWSLAASSSLRTVVLPSFGLVDWTKVARGVAFAVVDP